MKTMTAFISCLRVCVTLIVWLIIPMMSYAQIPRTISYQGYLEDSVGPVDGSVPMTFSLYSVDTGGTPLWTETHGSVAVKQGVYSVVLGSVDEAGNPLNLAFDMQYYLGVAVGADAEMTPRQKLTSVPYAMNSDNADTVDGQDASDLGDITGVTAGPGLTGGGTSGDVTLSADTGYLQRRVGSTCPPGQSIRVISSAGTVTCEVDNDSGGDITGVTAGPGLTGGGTAGTVTLTADTTVLQSRVNGSCPAGQSIRVISSTGTVTCEVDDTGADIDWTISGTDMYSGVSGNVGIGTDDPIYKVEVRDGTPNYLGYFVNDNDTSGSAKGILSEGDARGTGSGWATGGTFIAYGGGTDGGATGIEIFARAYGTKTAYGVYSEATVGSTTGREYAFYGIGDGYFSDNVGIGTADPNYKLEVRGVTPNYLVYINNHNIIPGAGPPNFTGGIYAAGDARNTGVDAGTGGVFYGYGGSTGGQASGIDANAYAYGSSIAYGVYSNATGGTTSGREYAFYGIGDGYFSGDVGIGTDNPVYPLDIAGHARVQGPVGFNSTGETAIIYYGDGNHSIKGIYAGGININSFDGASDPITFSFSGSERMRITNTGSVGIGITGPAEKLHVVGNIYATGSITPGSSRELKENIRALSADEALKALKDLYPQKFYYKTDKGDEHVGFIAEDVPELVATKDRQGVDPLDVVAVLTKVVQEQQKTIAELAEEMKDIKRELQSKRSLVMADTR